MDEWLVERTTVVPLACLAWSLGTPGQQSVDRSEQVEQEQEQEEACKSTD